MTKPIPDGYSTLIAHLTVSDGNAAIDFYAAAFGAEEIRRSPTPDGKIMHAELQLGDSKIFLSDSFGGPAPTPAGVTLNINTEDADALYTRAVAAGAKATMPLMDAFWGDRYGQVTDPFGHKWAIATHQHDYTPEQIEQKAQEYFSQFGAEH